MANEDEVRLEWIKIPIRVEGINNEKSRRKSRINGPDDKHDGMMIKRKEDCREPQFTTGTRTTKQQRGSKIHPSTH